MTIANGKRRIPIAGGTRFPLGHERRFGIRPFRGILFTAALIRLSRCMQNWIALSLGALLILVSCRSFDTTIIDQKISIDKRFAGYQVFVDSESLKAAFPDSHYDAKYRDNVRQLILNRLQIENNEAAEKGHLSVIVREVNVRDERLWFIGLITVVPAIFGMPYQRIDVDLNLDIALLNKQGKILRVFSVEGKYDVPNGIFYGYSDLKDSQAPADTAYAKTAIFKSLDKALIDAKIQLAYIASRMENEQ